MRAALAALLLASAAPALAFDEWSRTDLGLEGAYLALHLVDWGQTSYIAGHPDRYWEEVNPILGKHPSKGRVHLYFAASTVVQLAVAEVLPQRWRRAWIAANLSVKVVLVGKNARIGIGWEF